MLTEKVYLRQDVQVEPLFNYWYAWVHLIPPTTASLNLANRYMPVMNSYIDCPALHQEAVLDPDLKGGPFMDFDELRLNEIKELVKQIGENNKQLLGFAAAINELQQILKKQAKGMSMEPLYKLVPDILKGFVELHYDLNGNPSFRLHEALIYKSELFNTKVQSVALSIIKNEERPFILTTPRLKEEDVLNLPIAFSNNALDELFQMKRKSGELYDIAQKLNVNNADLGLFSTFFTLEEPATYQKYRGEGFRIRYFGHACILLETNEVSILIDPVLSYTYETTISRYTYEDLPDEIDYVLITHSHQDHILLETMLQIRHKVKNIVIGKNIDGMLQDPSLYLILKNLGFENIIELREMEELKFPSGKIIGIPFFGEHHDLLINSKLCYYIQLAGQSVLAVSDSVCLEPVVYQKVHDLIGKVDTLFIGMECDGCPMSWVYGPLFPEQIERSIDNSRRGRGCNYKEAITLVDQFKCREVYVYAMGQEPWLKHILNLELDEDSNPMIQSRKLIKDCTVRGIKADLLFAEREILNSDTYTEPVF